jgi:hypothetical protein
MNGQEIIDMAREAGLIAPSAVLQEGRTHDRAIEAFAKLVAAKHDPKIAIADAYRAGVDSGIAAEREACAIACETDGKDLAGLYYAGVIRARSCN